MKTKSNTSVMKGMTFAMLLILFGATGLAAFGQQKDNAAIPGLRTDRYSLSPDSPNKPKLSGFLVRLKGDNGVSIIDLKGNVISRNFTPVANSQGKVRDSNWTTPVLDDVFCIRREKESNGSGLPSTTVYHNASNPEPVPGLSDLYSANIMNPDLFPICRRGERIKFVDSKGNVKFTVMPVDGKEPRSVSPTIINGLIKVTVTYGVETKEYIDANGNKYTSIVKSAEKKGAVDTNGKWVIYPEYNRLYFGDNGIIIGWKGGEMYRIASSGKAVRDTRFDGFENKSDYPVRGKYIIETFRQDFKYVTNIYDLKQNFITAIDNAKYIRPNYRHPYVLCVRRNFESNDDAYNDLVDLRKNNTILSKNYKTLSELPDGNYLGVNYVKSSDVDKCWFVRFDGTAISLPDNCRFPLRHPLAALYYDTDIRYFIVEGNGSMPGYLCDFNGNRVGNISIEEYFNSEWEAEPVKSSYWRKYILGVDD